MKTNESRMERILRSSVGAALLIFAFSLEGPFDLFQGIFALTLAMFGGSSLVTGLAGWCPIYALFGVSTYSPKN